jgi:iron complex transport system ATP-binding protein
LQHLSGLVRSRAKAVVLALHDLNLARRYASHALLLEPGGSFQCGPVSDVMTEAGLSAAYGHPVIRARLGERELFVAE